MKKKKKKKKQKKVMFVRILLIFVIVEIFLLTLFFGAIYDNKQITENDCVKIVGIVNETYWIPRGGMRIIIDSKTYHLRGLILNNNVSSFDYIASKIENKEVVIWAKKSRHFPYLNNAPETTIVELRSDEEIFCEIENYNKYCRKNIIATCIGMPIIWFIITSAFLVALFVYKPRR